MSIQYLMTLTDQLEICIRRPDGGTRPWDGKSPLSIAAAILLIVTRMPKATKMPSISEISEVAMVADITLRSTARMLYDYAPDLMPQSFASQDTVAKIVRAMKTST